jgi:hypothetical protein
MTVRKSPTASCIIGCIFEGEDFIYRYINNTRFLDKFFLESPPRGAVIGLPVPGTTIYILHTYRGPFSNRAFPSYIFWALL